MCLVYHIRTEILDHVNFLHTVIVEYRKSIISRKDTLETVPCELYADWTHLAEGALNYKGFFATIIDPSELPLDVILVAHVVVMVDCFMWGFKVALE